MVKVFRIKSSADRRALRKGKAVPEMLERATHGPSDKRDRPEKERPHRSDRRPAKPSRKKAEIVHLDDHRPVKSMEEQLKGQQIRAPQYFRREQVQYARATSGAPRLHKHQQFAGPCRIT